jgi:hypothetical protein
LDQVETPVRLSKLSLNDIKEPAVTKSKFIKPVGSNKKVVDQKIEIYSKNEKGEIKLYDGVNSTPKMVGEKNLNAKE